jgi:amino acid transporter
VPLALGALRRQEPDRPRPYRLPAGSVMAPLAFIVANEVLLFSGWAVVWKLIVAILIGFALLAISSATSRPEERPQLDWRQAMWLWPYLLGMSVISYLSSFSTSTMSKVPLLGLNGPVNDLHFGVDVAVVAVYSLMIYWLAMRLRLPDERTRAYVQAALVEAEDEDELVEVPA